MAWGTTARGAYDAGDSGPTTACAFLVERNQLLAELPVQVEFPESTTQATVYTSVVTFFIQVPLFATECSLKAFIEVKVDAGTGDFRLYNVTNAADGAEVTGIVGVAYAESAEASLAIQAADADSLVEFGIKAKIDNAANTMFVRNADRLTFWLEV